MEEVKLFLPTDDTIDYIKNPWKSKNSTRANK